MLDLNCVCGYYQGIRSLSDLLGKQLSFWPMFSGNNSKPTGKPSP